jgi:alanine-glyoxylate transaminase/(R)-3-amino-2-methylpropionate-pyruvate transaminase
MKTPPEYFQVAVEIVRKYGGVFICDEVQTGFGRTGGKMFGIEHYGVTPDIMTMAKGVANGMPLGVTIATDEIANAFKSLTISTYGGNPMSSAAALATIDVIEGDELPSNSEIQGARLRAGLEELQQKHPKTIGDVRGMGLMQAIELVVDETAGDRTPNTDLTARLFEETKARGLLIGKGGLHGNAVRISPALNITASEIDEALSILGQAMTAATNGGNA